MAKTQSPCPPEFRQRMIELVRSGRTPKELAKEFDPSAQAIRNWVAKADRDEGRREDGLTTAGREELNRLRRENKQLKLEREILSKAAAWLARETDAWSTLLPLRSGGGRPDIAPAGLVTSARDSLKSTVDANRGAVEQVVHKLKTP
jgi:transposase